jgi:ATP-dependent Zn protease
MATALVAQMVGMAGMFPYFSQVDEDDVWIIDRFEHIGSRLINQTHSDAQDVIGIIMKNPEKRNEAYRFLGHAFVAAWNFVELNKEKVETVAQKLVEEKEIFGDDLNRLLDEQELQRFDYLDLEAYQYAKAWPVL